MELSGCNRGATAEADNWGAATEVSKASKSAFIINVGTTLHCTTYCTSNGNPRLDGNSPSKLPLCIPPKILPPFSSNLDDDSPVLLVLWDHIC